MNTDQSNGNGTNGETNFALSETSTQSAASAQSAVLPNSKKVYLLGQQHPNLRVPFREISLASTKTMSGELQVNEPVRVYDTSGPWGDEAVALDVEQGLPPLRRDWILKRGDVETVPGRAVTPQDDGWLSETHRNGNSKSQNPSPKQAPNPKFQRQPLRARNGNAVTPLWYARQGIVTPEMEFIAIRENARVLPQSKIEIRESKIARNDLRFAHPGYSFGANIPNEITPEFVRAEVARGRAIIPANINPINLR